MRQAPEISEPRQADRRHPMITVLGVRNLRLLWGGEGFSVLGSQFYLIALPWLVLQLTGDPFQMGTVLALAGIPRALFMLVSGAVIDRTSPRLVIIASNSVRLAVVLILAMLVVTDWIQIWMLYALALGFGFADAFLFPAQSAIIPRIVKDEQLLAANSIIQGTAHLSIAAGPALAGLLIALFGNTPETIAPGLDVPNTTGIAAAFVCNAIAFFLSIALIALIRIDRAPEPDENARDISGALAFFRQGLTYVLSDKTMRLMLLVASVSYFLVEGPLFVGIPVMADSHFQEGAAAFGIIMSGFGAGMLMGILAAGFLPMVRPDRMGTFLLLVLSASGAGLMLLGFMPDVISATVVVFLMGTAQGYVIINYNTWLQIRTPEALLGRVLSTMIFASLGLVPISQALCGALIKLNMQALFLGAGALLTLINFCVALRPEMRAMGLQMKAGKKVAG